MYDTTAAVAVMHSDTITKTTTQGISNITYDCVASVHELVDRNPKFEVTKLCYVIIKHILEYYAISFTCIIIHCLVLTETYTYLYC